MRNTNAFILTVISLSLFLFGCSSSSNKYGFVETKDGKSVYLDNSIGRVVFIDKSNRITDFVDLNLGNTEISRIKTDREKNDNAQKLRDWGKQDIAGTRYSVSLQTRYYKDRLLYITDLGPFDDSLKYKSTTIEMDLVDATGFSLEKIHPETWMRVVDDKGVSIKLQYRGEIPMTLDNYLEISSWMLQWKF